MIIPGTKVNATKRDIELFIFSFLAASVGPIGVPVYHGVWVALFAIPLALLFLWLVIRQVQSDIYQNEDSN